jgi:hypothetical protein
MQCIDEHQLSNNDSCALKVDGLPAVVFEVLDVEKCRLDVSRCLGEEPLKVGEEGRVVERPF